MSTLHTWEYLGRVASQLGHIRTVNGYRTNAGLLVTREPEQSELDDPARIIVLLDGMRQPEDPAMRGIGLQFVVAIVGQVPKSLNNAQQRMHELADDIHRCMGNRQLQMQHFAPGGEWPIPKFLESSVVPPAEGMNWTGVAARYNATVRVRTTPTTPIT